ncbi:hypothetical protein [Thalassospira indica]|nr:hypothetical protein [Thalassospira indica]
MPKLKHWTDSIPLAILMLISFFAGCLTKTKHENLEWETLLAGSMAIGAGFFALSAAKIQVHHQKEERLSSIRREEELQRINFLQEMEKFNFDINYLCEKFWKAVNSKDDKSRTENKLNFEIIKTQFMPGKIPTKPVTTKKELSLMYNQIDIIWNITQNHMSLFSKHPEIVYKNLEIKESINHNREILKNFITNFPKSNFVFNHDTQDSE